MNLKQITLCPYLIVILFFLTSPALLYADISTDGSVGSVQTLTGPDYTIPETLGTVKGDNLFHSFEKFSIKTQETATFTGSDSIKNVISRVTGGEKSEIDGTLRSNVGKADFYFINPNGVVFGQNAKVDVPAAFHVSTADELKFADGASFKASKSQQSTLTQAAPESFGFLETQSASIEVNGSNLEFKPESKVSLTSSKDITIKGTETKQASLTSYGGEIELKAKGDLLMDNATVGTIGNGGGKISVKANNAKIQNNSTIAVNNIGDKDSDGGITVDIDKQLELINNSYMASNAGEVTDVNGEIISTSYTWSKGDGGSMTINAGEITVVNGGEIVSDTFSKGNSGSMTINAGEITVVNGGEIVSDTFSKGNSGSMTINAGEITAINGGIIFTDTWSEGNSGSMTINAGEITAINGGIIGANTFSEGDAGNVKINAGKITIKNDSRIGSGAFSKGDSGSLIVNADELTIDGQNSYSPTGIGTQADPINATGTSFLSPDFDSKAKAGRVEITVSGLTQLINFGGISSYSFSKGDAGNILFNTDKLIMDNMVSIISCAYSEGYSGSININTDELIMDNMAAITSTTWSKGNAGNINVNAGELAMSNRALISSSTWSKGDAGYLTVNASHLVLDSSYILSTSFPEYYFSTNFYPTAFYLTAFFPNTSPPEFTGYVGNVKIKADSITLLNSSAISIASLQTMSQDKLSNLDNMPEEAKPTINLNTKQLTIESESKITSESTKNVPASDIKINADSIYLHDGLITTSVLGTNGDGGNISINEHSDLNPAGFLIMQNGLIQANTSAEGAKGGRIRINADNLIADKSMPLQIGGEPEEFSLDDKKNIIQAADPSKNPQDIESPTVPVDLGSSLISSGNTIFEPVTMAENYCRLIGTNRSSSLTLEPREWFVPAASANSSIYFNGYRLDELLRNGENN